MTICYICNNSSDDYSSIQNGRTQHSRKLFKELIEGLAGRSIDPDGNICSPCTTKLNELDRFKIKVEQIQNEIKVLLHNKIFIKEEPQEEADDASIGSYETEMNTDNEDDQTPASNSNSQSKTTNVSANFDWNSSKNNQEPKTWKFRKRNAEETLDTSKKSSKKQKNEEVFQCTFQSCDRRFPTKTRLLNHIQLHSKERPFQCSFCGKFYKTRDCLRSHQRVVHKNADLRVICDTCGLAFTRKPSLERHYKAAHLKLRTFICQLCGASYCNASSLQAHSFVHNKNNKNFVCAICEARFHTRSKLNRHMRCHGEKEFECPICHRKYSQRYNLTAHMKQVHEEYNMRKTEPAQPIICQLCGRLFDRQKTLKTHLKNVHEAVPISASLD